MVRPTQIHNIICKSILHNDADDVSGWISITDLAIQMHELKREGELYASFAFNTSPSIFNDEVILIRGVSG